MNWGNVSRSIGAWPWASIGAVLAIVFAGAALIVSIRAAKDGRRSADATVLAAEEARLSREAAERSVRVAEQSLLDQRQEAAERRAAEVEANRPRPFFVIERSSRQAFYLRNTGTGRATGVTLSAREEPFIFNGVADGDLAPNDAVPFQMVGASGRPIPGTLYLTWDGQIEEVAVAVPR
ncbi:hypothetical protein [Streptomyces sp. NPDC056707]|uniref:hypothetical protein n=1 Tax=Streptomyces sp. NPDC056707 TaxID=3345919 RepID=UPI0036C84786